MSVFEKLFKGKSTHAQFVGTRDGGWAAYLDGASRSVYKSGTKLKIAALIGAAVILGLAATPVLPAFSVIGLLIGLPGVTYAGGMGLQAIVRTDAETVMKGKEIVEGKTRDLLKNMVKQLRPF